MKRKTKRRVGIFLVVAMLAVMIYPAFSTTAEEESAGFIIENGELTAYTGSGGDITIPDTVTGISDNVFSGNTSLTSVTIPDGLTNIGDSAFEGCANLADIMIPDGLTNIGQLAFKDCIGLTTITIPDSVMSINKRALIY